LPGLRALAEKVSARLKAQQIAGQVVVLKLKTTQFKLRTRNARLDHATNLADTIYRVAAGLLLRETDGTSFRLIGVGVSDLGILCRRTRATSWIQAPSSAPKRSQRWTPFAHASGAAGLGLGLTFRPRTRSKPLADGSHGAQRLDALHRPGSALSP
jgi:hypothetical protein